MNLRHRLLKWIALGDMVMLNVDLANDGTIRSRNAGPMLIYGLKVWQWDRPYALSFGHRSTGASLHFEAYGNQVVTVENSLFYMDPPVPA